MGKIDVVDDDPGRADTTDNGAEFFCDGSTCWFDINERVGGKVCAPNIKAREIAITARSGSTVEAGDGGDGGTKGRG